MGVHGLQGSASGDVTEARSKHRSNPQPRSLQLVLLAQFCSCATQLEWDTGEDAAMQHQCTPYFWGVQKALRHEIRLYASWEDPIEGVKMSELHLSCPLLCILTAQQGNSQVIDSCAKCLI